jgi:DNA polymerase III sliding clamp (beta) subunit (PCNA family)
MLKAKKLISELEKMLKTVKGITPNTASVVFESGFALFSYECDLSEGERSRSGQEGRHGMGFRFKVPCQVESCPVDDAGDRMTLGPFAVTHHTAKALSKLVGSGEMTVKYMKEDGDKTLFNVPPGAPIYLHKTDEFRFPNVLDGESKYKVSQVDVGWFIKIAETASTDSDRTGITHVKAHSGGLCATDGHRLNLLDGDIEVPSDRYIFAGYFGQAGRLVGRARAFEDPSLVHCGFSESHFVLRGENWWAAYPTKASVDFPDYEAVIPKSPAWRLSISTERIYEFLKDAHKVCEALEPKKRLLLVRLDKDPPVLDYEVDVASGSLNSTDFLLVKSPELAVDPASQTADTIIAVNPAYFLKATEFVMNGGGDVSIMGSDSLSPIMLKSPGDGSLSSIVMPMRRD